MPNLQELLGHYNLSEQEVNIYSALLSLGKTGATQIAKKIGANRTAVYFHLSHLVDKKFVHQTRSGKSVRYVAASPRDLAESFERWNTDFKSLIPWMESLQKVETETPRIDVSDSRQGYIRLYDDISSLPRGSTLRVLEGCEAMMGEFAVMPRAQWHTFFARLVERKVETKALFTKESLESLIAKTDKKSQELIRKRIWHLRLVSEKILPFQKLLAIYGKKASFVFPATSLVVTIDHAEIVEALTCMFDGLYQLGEPSSTFSTFMSHDLGTHHHAPSS